MGIKYAIAIRLFSAGWIAQMKTEWAQFVSRILCFSPQNLWALSQARSQDFIKLNIGAGKQKKKGWVELDLNRRENCLRWDVRWNLPFRSGSVSKIHCEHFLEHLDYLEEAPRFLKECRRVIQPGGRVRIILPDVKKYIEAYENGLQSFWEGLRDLGGGPKPFKTRTEILNQMFRMGVAHRFAYDFETLKLLLESAGFRTVEEKSFDPEREIDQPDKWRTLESLYVEATN